MQTFYISGQVCTITYTQTQVGIYPDSLPNATVGQPYSQDITFVLPTDTMGFDFTNFHILSVSLPVGLNWSCNHISANCNYNPQISTYGCVHIYGIPLLSGNYNLQVTIIADLSIVSGYPFVFEIPLQISSSTMSYSNSGFSIVGAEACAPALVEFSNLHPGLPFYHWDFGNGNMSNEENPGIQYYGAPGTYIVQYEAYASQDTTIVYTLENLNIHNMSNYGGGFPTFESADAYFKILENGAIVYQSSTIGDQNPPIQWALSLNLNPNSVYSIEIWEADESYGEAYFGNDDFIGNQILNLNGCMSCSVGSAHISYYVSQQFATPTPQVLSIDTIVVYPIPNPPVISYDSLAHVISTSDFGLFYQWYFNGSPIAGAINPALVIAQSGAYSLVAVNSSGCVAFSDTLDAIYCNPFIQPLIAENNGVIFVTNVAQNATFNWLLDGQILSNAQNHTLSYTQNGFYQCVVTDPFGCIDTSQLLLIEAGLSTNNIEQPKVFPNPAKDFLNVSLPHNWLGSSLEIINLLGKVLYTEHCTAQKHTISLHGLQPGTYLIQFSFQNLYYQQLLCISTSE
jgi:hypothetical protein